MRTGLDGALMHFGLWHDDALFVRAEFAFHRGAVVGRMLGRFTRVDREELRLYDADTGTEIVLRLSEECDFWFRDTRDHPELATTYADGITILFSSDDDPAMVDRVMLMAVRDQSRSRT